MVDVLLGNRMKVQSSSVAKRTTNPIRNIVDASKVIPNPDLEILSLSLGDPTVFGNLQTAVEVTEAVKNAVDSHKADGYVPVIGSQVAREAICQRYKSRFGVSYAADDIVITSGCSGALDLAISVLCSPQESSILISSPGFTLYQTHCSSKAITTHKYPLLPEQNWEIDLQRVEELLKRDNNITAWLINNPSNPCGSVYSQKHLEACLALAEKYKIVIIADEIYEDMVFSGQEYVPLARISKRVPILTCSGLVKRFLVPGWRFGWIGIHDAGHDLSEIRKGLFDLSGLIIGANTLIQGALPDIFQNTPDSFFQETNAVLEENARLVHDLLSQIPQLKVIKPQGTLYMLVGINTSAIMGIRDDVDFTEQLLASQSVSVLPGTIFGAPGFFRIVYSAPKEHIQEACTRIKTFCLSKAQ